MAELAITTVKPTVNSPTKLTRVQVGEAVNEGDFGYKNGTKYYKCVNSSSAAANCTVIFGNTAALDGYAYIFTSGDEVDIGVSTTAGEDYCVSGTAGNAEDHASVGSGEYVTPLFVGSGSSVITFQPRPSGYAKP